MKKVHVRLNTIMEIIIPKVGDKHLFQDNNSYEEIDNQLKYLDNVGNNMWRLSNKKINKTKNLLMN